MDYLAWNNALAGQFFRGENSGRRVFLYVTTELIARLGATANAVSDFVAAVQAGPPWVTRTGLCQRALQAMDDWRLRDCEYPPYIGYLGAFVLAATLDGPFPAHAYYPRLNGLLGEPSEVGMPPSFNRMYAIWSDLEKWSNVDKDGQVGIFTADIVGGWLHVGIPLAQTLLTDKERTSLPAFFASCDFDPEARPTDFELKRALLATPPEYLRPRTVALLESVDPRTAELRAALVGIVSDDLRHWDGSIAEAPSRAAVRQIPLRLCLQFDPVTAAASFSLRCRVTDGSVWDEIEVQQAGSEQVFECNSLAMGWTSALVDQQSGALVDASHVDWAAGIAFSTLDQRIHLRLPALRVRTFVSGAQVALPGFVENRHLTPNTALYVAAHECASSAVMKWGASECLGFREVAVRTGLPSKWRLYRADAALADSLIKDEFPNVSFPASLRLWLNGGVRAQASSNQYFAFAPPRVEVADAGNLVPTCDGRPCRTTLGEGCYCLPDALPCNAPLRVKIESTDGTRQQRFFTLLDDFSRNSGFASVWFDRFGVPTPASAPSTPRYSGALVRDGPGAIACFILPSLSRSGAAILLGRRPGQIARWPSDEYPSDWTPIWVVRSRRQTGHLTFWGGQIEDSEPCTNVAGTRRQLNAWKQIIWHRRRRISPPQEETLRALWGRYQQVAHDA